MQDLEAPGRPHGAVRGACALLEPFFREVAGELGAPALRRLHMKLWCHLIDSYREALGFFEGELLPASLEQVKQDARSLRQLFAAHAALPLGDMLPRYELLKVGAPRQRRLPLEGGARVGSLSARVLQASCKAASMLAKGKHTRPQGAVHAMRCQLEVWPSPAPAALQRSLCCGTWQQWHCPSAGPTAQEQLLRAAWPAVRRAGACR